LLRFVGQGGECKTAVGEAHPLGIFAEDLIGGLHNLPLVFCHGLPSSLFDPMQKNQLMNLSHNPTVTFDFHNVNLESGGRNY
jgi:hypothetical protein